MGRKTSYSGLVYRATKEMIARHLEHCIHVVREQQTMTVGDIGIVAGSIEELIKQCMLDNPEEPVMDFAYGQCGDYRNPALEEALYKHLPENPRC